MRAAGLHGNILIMLGRGSARHEAAAAHASVFVFSALPFWFGLLDSIPGPFAVPLLSCALSRGRGGPFSLGFFRDDGYRRGNGGAHRRESGFRPFVHLV